MKLPFVSRKKYEASLEYCESLREELTERSSLTIPMISMRGIGVVKLIGTPDSIKLFQKYIEQKGIQWKKQGQMDEI